MADYSLTLYQSALGTSTPVFVADITKQATYWQRSIHAQGGPLEGSFRVVGPLHELQNWFYSRLGWHVEEVCGGKTWAGMIYEMDLCYLGATRRRSLDDVYNYVTVRYDSEGEIHDTAAGENAGSLAKYGRREEFLLLKDYSETEGLQLRDLFLREHAFPWPRPLTASVGLGESYLDVTVIGYWKTMEWRYTSIQNGTLANVSDFIINTLAADCADYLTVGTIRPNTLQVHQSTPMPQRAWDTLQEQVAFGGQLNGVAVPYRLYVDTARRCWYEPVDTTPRYAIRDDGLYPYAGGGKVSPYQVVPAVIRDMRYPAASVEDGSWLPDVRDTWVEKVDVDADGKLRLTTSLYAPEETYQAVVTHQEELNAEVRSAAHKRAEEERQKASEAWANDAAKHQHGWVNRWYRLHGLKEPYDPGNAYFVPDDAQE